MTSNVVALPGIGVTPHTPVREAASTSPSASKPEAEKPHGHRNFSSPNSDKQQAANNNAAAPTRPNSPVALNSLLSAQEQGAEAPAEQTAQQPAEQSGQAGQLSEAEEKQVAQLKKNDAAIHRHEQAHAAAGGQYAGAPQYTYTNGPDGKRYANAGSVSIDVTPVAGDPKATIEKMDVVQRAANAPAEPSGADRSVAAKAAAAKQTAQIELAQLKAEELSGTEAEGSDNAPSIGIPRTDGEGDGNSHGVDKNDSPAATAAKATAASHAAAAAAYAAPLNAIAGA